MSEKSVVERIIERLEKEKRLVSNYEYISWLENFTSLHESFNDSTWLYFPEKISNEDSEKLDDLTAFFEGIKRYCDKYYINTEGEGDFAQECIHIKHNNIGYEISLVVGQGALICVSREEPIENAVNFNDIISDSVPDDFEIKENLLKTFECVLCNVKGLGISKEVVNDIVEKHFSKKMRS